jgi:hypothetical protein
MRPGYEGCSVWAEDSGSFLPVPGQPASSVSRAGWILGLPQFHLRFHSLCAGADTKHGHFLVSYEDGMVFWILLNPESAFAFM